MRVTVLRGGPSSEREVSLKSGAAVAAALREGGHDVFESDVSPDDLTGLDRPADAVFPVLHGRFGESGELQAILEERRKIPFVGSGSAASRVGIDKHATKAVWRDAGLPVPADRLVTGDDDVASIDLPAACVVKALGGGSSIGVSVFRDARADAATVRETIAEIVADDGRCLVEAFVAGTELTVGVLFDAPLPPIRIAAPAGGFFDFQSKYAAVGGAEHHFDLQLPGDVTRVLGDLALRAHRAVGCRDLSRVDVIVERSGDEYRPFLLEVNTLPGFTSRSLLPEAAARAGVPFVELCSRLVGAAAARGG